MPILGCCRGCGADIDLETIDSDLCRTCVNPPVNDRVALTKSRDLLEAHVSIQGGCQQQMFLGDCADCERYFALTDEILRQGG